MKNSLLLFFLLTAMTSCGQKKLPIKEVPVTDGGKYEYILYPKQDSLRWYNPGKDTFKITVTFERLQNGYPMPDVITDVDNALSEYSQSLMYQPQSFSGDNILNPLGWTFSKDQLFNVVHHNNTLAKLRTDGWVDFSFTGYKVEYYAEMLEGNGIAGVSIDKGPETMVDLYHAGEINNSTMVFVADSLDNATPHIIRVRYTGQRNPNSNSGYATINLDKFTTYWHQGNLFVPPAAAVPAQMYEPPKPSH